MLKGIFRYGEHQIEFSGYDINNTLFLDVETATTRERTFWDAGIEVDGEVDPADWGARGLAVMLGPTNLSLKKQTLKLSDSLKYHNEINKVAFKIFGSLIRSAKNAASAWNRVEGTDNYTLPEGKGIVTMVDGELIGLHITDTLESPEGYGEANIEIEMLIESVDCTARQVQMFSAGHKITLDGSLFDVDINGSDQFSTLDDGDYYTIEEVVKRNPKKNYSWLMEQDYTVVTPETLADTVKYLWQYLTKHDSIGAFDVETTGLDITFRSRDGEGSQLVGMVFSVKKGESFYFPIAHNLIPNICNPSQIAEFIDKWFKPLLERKKWSGHNISFDWKTMYIYGVNTNFVFDTLTAARLTIWNDKQNVPLNLKGLSLYLLGRDSLELSDFVDGGWDDSKSFADLDSDSTKYYACADTDNTFDLTYWFKDNRILEKYAVEKVFMIEVLFSKAIGYSEFFGMYGEPERIKELDARLGVIIEEKAAEMRDMLDWPEFNPNSPKDLPKAMFEDLGMPITKRTATGAPSTDKDVRKALKRIIGPDEQPIYPFVAILDEYKVARQLRSNFTSVYEQVSKNGFFFASVNQFLETGRVSISKPNYQSFDDTVKEYIGPRKGFYCFDTDFSSIEYRVLVSIAGESKLTEKFFDPDFDYHREMASILYGIPYDQVTGEIRGKAKALNFGIPYGMSVPGLAVRMFGSDSPDNVARAQKLYDLYFSSQDNVRDFFNNTKDYAVEHGFNATAFGRPRYYDKRKNNNNRIKRQAGNHPIQGTAADIYKLGVVRLMGRIFEDGNDGKILLSAFVHDECVIEAHETIDPAYLLGIVRDSLMIELKGWCPLYIGAGYGKSWVEAKKTELPVQVQEAIVRDGVGEWGGDVDALNDRFKVMMADFYVDSVKTWATKVEGESTIPTAEMGFLQSAIDSAKKGIKSNYLIGELEGEVGDSILDTVDAFEALYGNLDLPEGAKLVEAEVVEVVDSMADFTVNPDDIQFAEVDHMSVMRTRLELTGIALSEDVVYVRFYETVESWGGYLNSLIATQQGEYPLTLVDDSGNLHETEHRVALPLLSLVTKYVLHNKLNMKVAAANG